MSPEFAPVGSEETAPEDANDAVSADELEKMFLTWLQEHLSRVEVVWGKPVAWCSQWWLHPEAVARFKALWKAWLAVEQDEDLSASSHWWVYHWDHHAQIIFDKTHGPFRDCDTIDGHLSHAKEHGVPFETPPEGIELI